MMLGVGCGHRFDILSGHQFGVDLVKIRQPKRLGKQAQDYVLSKVRRRHQDLIDAPTVLGVLGKKRPKHLGVHHAAAIGSLYQ